MPRLSKLRLSKLNFVSLVDSPAQLTADIRLIKRDGADTDDVEIKATAEIVKIGEGDDPLIYCWAFTCTGEDGQPYHDLQGDAIEPDAYIKAAEEFMHSGAAVDEMHDGKRTSRVAFAFPMDSDIAAGMFGKAIGGQVKTSGLMVAIRPSKEALAKARSGKYKGVSIAGLGTRQELTKREPPARVSKSAVLMTTAEEGHQHSIDMSGYDDSVRMSGQTSDQTAEGADHTHSHAWSRDPQTNAVLIAMDSGHTHEVASDGPDEEPDADYDDSTPQQEDPTVKSMPDLSLFKRALDLPEEHRAYLAQLEPEEAAELLTNGKLADEFAKADAEDPVVFTSQTGEVFRKSDDPRMVTLAKRNDEQAAELAVSKAAREQVELEKRASADLGHLPGTLVIKAAALRAVDSIADEATRKSVTEMIRAGNVAMKALGKPNGANPGDVPAADDPVAKFNTELETFAKSVNKTPVSATADFLRTQHGAELYQATQTQSRN